MFQLPWPPKILNPNSRPHWAAKAKAVKKYRADAMLLTLSQRSEPLKSVQGHVPISLVFHPPDRRRRDLDGCLSSLKSALDGIADGLDINDQRFQILMKMGEPVKNGSVEVTL